MNFKEFLIEHEFFHVRAKTRPESTVYLDMRENEDQETYNLSANQVEQKPINPNSI